MKAALIQQYLVRQVSSVDSLVTKEVAEDALIHTPHHSLLPVIMLGHYATVAFYCSILATLINTFSTDFFLKNRYCSLCHFEGVAILLDEGSNSL